MNATRLPNYIGLMLALLLPFMAQARWDVDKPTPRGKTKGGARTAAACEAASSSAELDINNVRALLHNGGDMWWDLASNPRYEVPKVDNPASAKHSMFAASLWIGGFDGSGQLRIAAQTYRQSGNDFWPGPLLLSNGETDDIYCEAWDQHYRITSAEISEFRAAFEAAQSGAGSLELGNFPNVRDWPGTNPDAPLFEKQLAPYVDVNNDQEYRPEDGDYPDIRGDQAIWWVINDKGDVHTSTNGEQVGVEIQMLAFAFQSATAVNDMTFYRQTVINRSSNLLEDCYIGQWCDADLGFFADDFVGCDTVRGLGFCYNGAPVDQLPNGYGDNPPAIGIDFFQGPVADFDSIGTPGVNDQNETNETIGMARFIYYNNDFTVTGNPVLPQNFYGYLAGFWKNGSPIVDDRTGNGNGFPDANESTAEATNFMFPDYPGAGCGASPSCPSISYAPGTPPWDEVCSGNTPFDRRFVQSAGPFTLLPGAVNEVIVGAVWARNFTTNSQYGSICQMMQADDVAQTLFDNDFDLLDGPDAPQVELDEYDRELVLTWRNNSTSNNAFENYSEFDPLLAAANAPDTTFDFEGYLVYQIIDDRVGITDLQDANVARVIAQCDIRNDVTTIVNRSATTLPGTGEEIVNDMVMVDGENNGIFHSLRITEDVFATTTESRLVNYRPYYFLVLAYAYNPFATDGQRFIISPNASVISAIPHKTEFENFGTVLNSSYGSGVELEQVAGAGNGGLFLELSEDIENTILQNNRVNNLRYKGGAGPVSMKVTNPKNVKDQTFRVVVTRDSLIESRVITDPASGLVVDTLDILADWVLFQENEQGNVIGEPVFVSRYTFSRRDSVFSPEPLLGTERNIDGFGISLAVQDAVAPGFIADSNGVIGGQTIYSGPEFLIGFPDINNQDQPEYDWVRSGASCDDSTQLANGDSIPNPNGGSTCPNTDGGGTAACLFGECVLDRLDQLNTSFIYQYFNSTDPNRNFEDIAEATGFAPYLMTNTYSVTESSIGPRLPLLSGSGGFGFDDTIRSTNTGIPMREFVHLPDLPNVDIVITPDPTKWSKCIVIESSPSQVLSNNLPSNVQGAGSHPMTPRFAPSLELQPDGSLTPQVPNLTGVTDRNDAALAYGYSYFPGYAVDVDRGVRLNIFFAEASWYRSDNGADMIWNPTGNLFGEDGFTMSGRHYVYVTNQEYDECRNLAQYRVRNLTPAAASGGSPFRYDDNGLEIRMDSIFKHVAWTGMPVIPENFVWDDYRDIPGEARVQLRVNRPFTDDNGVRPTYKFSTSDLAAQLNVEEVAEQAVTDQINIVPNPFYGRSGTGAGSYELAQLDNRVKITNLPQKCTIRIFTLNGQLVRIFRKDSDEPDQEWDLRNNFGVPIASGMYLLHIDAEGLGEKILKFFCILPEIDLNAY